MLLPHTGIALLLIALEDKSVHLRLDEVHRLVALEVVLHLPPEVLDFTLDLADLRIDLLEVRAELRVDDIVVLLRFPYVDALLKHFPQFGEIFQGCLQLVQDLGPQGVVLIHKVLIQVPTELL